MGIVNSNLQKNRKCLKQCKFNGAENQAGYFYVGEWLTQNFCITLCCLRHTFVQILAMFVLSSGQTHSRFINT
jgi:hypothetical protein